MGPDKTSGPGEFLIVRGDARTAPSGSADYAAAISWSKRMSMVATCARVAWPLGTRVSAVSPFTSFTPTAYCMASTAYSLIWSASA